MFLDYYDSPIPHAVIKDYFNEQELNEVWEEINFLTYKDKLLSADITGSATNNSILQKKNHGIFLDGLYTNRATSNILKHTRKLWNSELTNFLKEKHFIFRYLETSNLDITLLNYYDEDDYYNWHYDYCILSAVIHLYKEPLKFSGGDFMLENENCRFPIENNRMIIFPSCANHAVTPIKFNEPTKPFSKYGRYTISQFILFKGSQ
jgi:predicted 2-oxoglutarate/Fe(II)-dependent dioxygenase YbiX